MIFFFQTNPIRVIFKFVLAIPSVIIAVGGCFCSTVHKMSNKVRTSIIKRASHGSGAWIKASCSESMCFCKKNIQISNVINTFLSLPVSVICKSRSGGWRRTYLSRTPLLVYAILVRLFTGAKEAKFPYFSKWTPVSSWLISKSSLQIFLYKSSFSTSNYFLRHPPEWLPHMTVRWSEIQKRMDSLREAFIHALEPCEACFIIDACTLFDVL